MTKEYQPLHDGISPIACGNCQRVFTSSTQVGSFKRDGKPVCASRAACSKRKERLMGIHVKLWRDLCEFLAKQPFQEATDLQIPEELQILITRQSYRERNILDQQYLLPIFGVASAWVLHPDWQRRLQRIEQGELVRHPGDMEVG